MTSIQTSFIVRGGWSNGRQEFSANSRAEANTEEEANAEEITATHLCRELNRTREDL
jgi:hypothetical protein